MLIYKWTNKINGKMYVGQTSKTLAHRTRMHVNSTNAGCDLPIHNAIRKYGIDNFIVEIIATPANLKELNALEIQYISQYGSRVPKGYNLKVGGDNHTWHPKSIEKARKSAKRRMAADGGHQFKAAAVLGRKALEGKSPWNVGKQATEEAKNNQSKAHLGQKAWNKGAMTPEAVREKQRIAAAKRSKAILCIETKQRWVSKEACAKEIGFSTTHIGRLIKSGRKHEKTGLSFKLCDNK